MSSLANKIEIYHAGNLIYTLENKTEAGTVKSVITDNVGTFTFTLPTKIDHTYQYDDIVVWDDAKIYLDDGTHGLTNVLSGKIYQINAPQTGKYERMFTGRDYGEILLRLYKTKRWVITDASTIITELANNLGLGTTQIDADTTDVTLSSEEKNYWDLIRDISDYWYNAGSQINKDFYVDTNKNLVWKTRPLRSSGVETLTVGQNISSYHAVNNRSTVFNKIYQYGGSGKIGTPGQNGRLIPADESWTQATTGWTDDYGTSSAVAGAKVGTLCIRVDSELDAAVYKTKIRRTVNVSTLGNDLYQTLNFYHEWTGDPITLAQVQLYAPDASNYFYASFTPGALWAFEQFKLGENQEYDAYENPTGPWHIGAGSPVWNNLPGVVELCFYATSAVANHAMFYDGLYFGHGKYRYTAEDATSQTNYGISEKILNNPEFKSDAECESRAKTLLSIMKDPLRQIEITTLLNTNIKIGDRIPLTIPAENITAVNFDVIAVEHYWPPFMTTATLTETVRHRTKTLMNQRDTLLEVARLLAKTSKDVAAMPFLSSG